MLWLLSSAPSVQPEFILCVDAEKAFDQVNEMKNNIVVTWKQLYWLRSLWSQQCSLGPGSSVTRAIRLFCCKKLVKRLRALFSFIHHGCFFCDSLVMRVMSCSLNTGFDDDEIP